MSDKTVLVEKLRIERQGNRYVLIADNIYRGFIAEATVARLLSGDNQQVGTEAIEDWALYVCPDHGPITARYCPAPIVDDDGHFERACLKSERIPVHPSLQLNRKED